MSIIVACMAKNEADRFWRSALDVWNDFADEIVVLDDGSSDETAEIAREVGATVVSRGRYEASAWGTEAPARASLFDLAWSHARVEDWIFILDADMIPARDPRSLPLEGYDAVAFALFDLWDYDVERDDDEWTPSRLYFRSDGFWRGHLFPRVWMVRKTKETPEGWRWSDRGIHVGHLPLNFPLGSVLIAPPEHGLLHFSYVTPEARERKFEAYASVATQLHDAERRHAVSIIDEEPHLEPLWFEPTWTLLRSSSADSELTETPSS